MNLCFLLLKFEHSCWFSCSWWCAMEWTAYNLRKWPFIHFSPCFVPPNLFKSANKWKKISQNKEMFCTERLISVSDDKNELVTYTYFSPNTCLYFRIFIGLSTSSSTSFSIWLFKLFWFEHHWWVSCRYNLHPGSYDEFIYIQTIISRW